MRYVLDATALRSGAAVSGESECHTTPSVLGEVKRGAASKRLALLLESGNLRVSEPNDRHLDAVKKAASETGDLTRLSGTDLDILALALELGAKLLSDDYSVQNVARVLGVEIICTAEAGIREVFVWGFRCRGCGRRYENKMAECPVCGSEVRTVRKR